MNCARHSPRPKIKLDGGFIRRYQSGAGWLAYAYATDGGRDWRTVKRTRAQAEEFIKSRGRGGWRPDGVATEHKNDDGSITRKVGGE